MVGNGLYSNALIRRTSSTKPIPSSLNGDIPAANSYLSCQGIVLTHKISRKNKSYSIRIIHTYAQEERKKERKKERRKKCMREKERAMFPEPINGQQHEMKLDTINNLNSKHQKRTHNLQHFVTLQVPCTMVCPHENVPYSLATH